MRICSGCLMPHCRRVLWWPKHAGGLTAFMQRLAITRVRPG